MTVVNFVLSNRDNVGKTFITWLLAQYKNSHGQKYKLFDADSNLSTCISRYGALNSRKGAISTDDFDELLSAIKSSYHDVIVDLPASFYRSAITAFKEKDYALLKNLEELDFKVVFHLPVGGNDFILQESVNAVNEVLTTLVEALIIFLVCKSKYIETLLHALAANMTSFIVGLLLNYLYDLHVLIVILTILFSAAYAFVGAITVIHYVKTRGKENANE